VELPAFADALSRLLTEIEHSYANSGQPIPADPWVVIADERKGAR
jgi:hypothetical protein